MRRLDGWEARLAEVIEAERQKQFSWGVDDCFSFVCSCIEAMTGEDVFSPWRGRYATERESLRLMARHGHNITQAGDWFFGASAIAPARARRGDVVMFATAGRRKPLGVCLGARSAARSVDGLVFLPTLSAIRAWRVG